MVLRSTLGRDRARPELSLGVPSADGSDGETLPSPPEVSLALLGGFNLSFDAEAVALPMGVQRLVTFIALHDKPVLRAYVAGSLWGDADEHRAGGSLRSALWKLGDRAHALVEVKNDHLQLAPMVTIDLRD